MPIVLDVNCGEIIMAEISLWRFETPGICFWFAEISCLGSVDDCAEEGGNKSIAMVQRIAV